MAFDKLILKNPATGEIKQAPVGFSWTTLFFGLFPALIRADWKYGAIQFLVACVTFNLSQLVFPFIYNKLYIKDLVYKNGFKVTGTEKGNIAYASTKLGIELPQL